MANPFFNHLTAEARREWRLLKGTEAYRQEVEELLAHRQEEANALAEVGDRRAPAVLGELRAYRFVIELMTREEPDEGTAEDDGWIDKATPQSKRPKLT